MRAPGIIEAIPESAPPVPPPASLLRMMGLPEESWQQLRMGTGALTFIHPEWILQRRGGESLACFRHVLELAHLSELPGLGGLHFLHPPYEEREGEFVPLLERPFPSLHRWWLAQPRLPGQVLLAGQADWREAAQMSWPNILRGLTRLWREPIPPGLWKLPPTRSLHVQTVQRDWLREHLRADWPAALPLTALLGEERSSRIVLAHGDAILKNVVLDRESGRAQLIDWELLSPLPLSCELLHWFSYLLMRESPQHWRERAHQAWLDCRVSLEAEDWEEGDFLNALAWYVLRGGVGFPSQQALALWTQGLRALLQA